MDDDHYDDDELWDTLDLSELDSAPAAQPVSRATSLAPPSSTARTTNPPPPRPSQLPLKRPLQPQPPPTQRFGAPLYGTAKPSGILRPAQPPQRKKPRVDPPAPPLPAPQPPAKEQQQEPQRVGLGRYGSRNERGEPGFVDPNPWAERGRGSMPPSTAQPVKAEPPSQPPRRGAGRSGMEGVVEQRKEEVREEEEEEEEEEEDLPAIQLDEAALLALDSAAAASAASGAGGGGGMVYRAEPQRGVTVARPPPPVQVRPQQQQRVAVQTQGAGGGGGMTEAEKRELEQLRAEKAKLQEALASTQTEKARLEQEVATKMGENRIVRAKLGKAEAAHAAALKLEKRDRQQLQDELEKKEKEYKASVDRMKMEEAFRRQELATASASRHRSSSQRPTQPTGQGIPGLTSANSQRFYHRASTSVAPTSPSLGRSRSERAASARPSGVPQQPAFGARGSGFNTQQQQQQQQKGGEGFAMSQSQPVGGVRRQQEREREGSMGPPKFAGGGAGGKKNAEKSKGEVKGKEKGKGKALQLQEDESFFGGGMDGDGDAAEEGDTTLRHTVAQEEEEPEEEGCGWEWVPPVRDERAELLAAVFAHTTLHPVDTEPAVVLIPPPGTAHHHHQHHHHHHGGRGRQSFPPTSTSASSAARLSSRSFAASHSTAHPPHSALSSSTPAQPSEPSGPFPTLHALLNLRLPPSTPPILTAHYESTCRSLFALLGRVVDPTSSTSSLSSSSLPHLHPHSHPSEIDLPTALSSALTSLLATLDAARLPGAMTTLLRLLSALVFAFEGFGRACSGAVGEVPVLPVAQVMPAGGGGGRGGAQMMGVGGSMVEGAKEKEKDAPGAEKDKKKPKMERVHLLPLLARIVARYGRPDPPAASTSSNSSRLGTSPSTASTRPTFARSRKARLARPITSSSSSSSSSLAGQDKNREDVVERVPLERGKREKLLEGVIGVVEGVGWRVAAMGEAAGGGEGGNKNEMVTEGEDAFIAFVRTPCAIATLLDPRQPVGILLSAVRILTLFACRPALFRPLLGVKFFDAPDTKNSKLPLVDRIATLLAMPRTDSAASHHLSLSLLSLSLRLLTKHEDALMLVVQSASFVPEVLAKMWRDVRTVWEWDGREVGGKAGEGLKRTTHRLSLLVHLLYYLAHAPHSSLTIGDLLTGGPANASLIHPYQLQAVNDLFTSALGTLAFATIGGAGAEEEGAMPSWTAEEGSEKERERLVELGYLAQELLEDVSPLELEEIEVCFGPPDAEEGDEDDEMDEDEMEMQEAAGEEEMGMMVDEGGRDERVEESQL